MEHTATLLELQNHAYTLYTRMRDDRFFPETLALLGRDSLIAGACLQALLPISYLKYGERPEDIPPQKPVGKTLVFKLQSSEGFSLAVKEAMQGRIYRIAVFYNHADVPHYEALTLPERTRIWLPTRS